MGLVPDASAFLCLAFKDEGLAYGFSVVDAVRDQGGLVPPIFWYEIRNALIVNERRRRIAPSETATFLALLDELPLSIEPLPADSGVLQLAREHQLSVYDASYLELALREGLPLATLDNALAQATKKCKVSLWGAA
jgi:predicted nucleic acid-binding protein